VVKFQLQKAIPGMTIRKLISPTIITLAED
jgi:hypothetical protein